MAGRRPTGWLRTIRIAWLIAVVDVRRRMRDRSAVLLAFVAPVAIASLLGVAFGGDGTGPVVRVAVADEDRTPASRALLDGALASLSLSDVVAVVRVDSILRARQLYEEDRVAGVIELHPGVGHALDARQPMPIHWIATRRRPLGRAATEAIVVSLRARQEVSALALHAAYDDPAALPPGERAALDTAARQLRPAVRVTDDSLARGENLLGFFGPSIAIVFLFFSIGLGARALLSERAGGTLARMRAAPVPPNVVVAGKALSIGALMLLTVLVLWASSSLLFGASWGSPAGVIVLALATVAAIEGIGLLLMSGAKDPVGAQALAAGVGLVLAIFGGNFFPPGALPPSLERAALLTPNGWALEGFTVLAIDGGGVGDVLRPVAALVAIAGATGAAAVVQLRRTVLR